MAEYTSKFDVVKRLQAETRQVIAFVSGGKDSIANLLLMRDYGIDVYPVYLYVVPDIKFVDDYLGLLERRLGITIHRMIHPVAVSDMQTGYLMTPVSLPNLKFTEVEAAVRAMSGREWIVGGEKKNDSLQRRGMLSECNGMNYQRRRAFPLAEWSDSDVFAMMKRRGVSVPADYGMFTGSWGGSTLPKHLYPIKQRFPEDFEKIKKVYPMADAAVLRYQQQLARMAEEY